MRIDIWSDVLCPWCYIGKRRLEKALAQYPHSGDVELHWRSFELDPNAPTVRAGDPAERLARKYGISVDQARNANRRLTALAEAEGLDYQLASTRSGNSFDAHRLIHLAAETGQQDEMKERLLSAYLCEEQAIGDPEVLYEQAVKVGLQANRVREVLDGEEFADAVRADEAEASAREISAVPFFLIDDRFGIPGAQDTDTILAILNRAWDKSHRAAG